MALKNGGRGTWCADEKDMMFIEPVKCTPVDPIGAGDGFNAGFLAGVIENRDLETCGRMGAIVGALATETYGGITGYSSREILEQRLSGLTQIYR